MTRLSDHLRGLADRAPVADSVISVEVASRRIHRHRRLRTGANAAAGVGAAAVIAVAAINPGAGANDSVAGAAESAIAGDSKYDQMLTMEDTSRLAWGFCGSYPLSDESGETSSDTLMLGGLPVEISGGDTLTLDATLVPASSGEWETFGAQVLILWDGMVVASGTADAAQSAVLSLTAGEPVEQSVSADLVDCWEGAPLPGGTYQALGVQELYAPVEVGPPLPTDPTDPTEPAVDPVMPVEPAVAPPPEAAIDDTTVESGLASDAVNWIRVVSSPVDFVIAGDVPEDPFGQYQPIPVEPIDTPDDLLTPADAREGYDSRVTSTPWAMEAGSQRVLKPNDSADPNADLLWQQNYFGCAWDAGQNEGFPATSAEWDLLDVSASLPTSIDVSYGWVVEGNPTVDLSVTNISGRTLPGYWGSDPNTSLVLVRDGKVVAEGYPVQARRDGQMIEVAQDGMLSPGANLGGTYLWRDVNGCYNGDDPVLVGAGTYTVLNVQSINFDSGQLYDDTFADGGVPEPALDKPAIQDGAATSGEAGMPSDWARSTIAPGPVDYDWIELQVWTSLGTITVN